MNTHFIYKLLLTTTFLATLLSCASGPTQEQLDRWAKYDKMLEDNTNHFVERVMSEIWHQPIIAEKEKYGYGTKIGVRHLSKPLSTAKLHYSYKVCNGLSAPPLYVKTETYPPNKNRPNDVKVLMAVGFSLIINNAKEVKDCGESTFRRLSSHDQVSPALLNAKIIRDRLLEKGMPLVFCRESSYDSGESIECSIDIGVIPSCSYNSLMSRNLCTAFTPSITIRTSRNKLSEFKIERLNINIKSYNKTLAEIYHNRFKNPAYVKSVSDYFDHFVGMHKENDRRQAERWAAEDAYYAKLDAQHEAAIAQSRYESFGNTINQSANRLKTEKWGLSNPQIQAAGTIGRSTSSSYKGGTINKYNKNTSRREENVASVDVLIPKGQPKSKELQANASKWCDVGGGSFNAITGKCVNRSKDNCLKQGRKWMGDRCDSKTNVTRFPGRACAGGDDTACDANTAGNSTADFKANKGKSNNNNALNSSKVYENSPENSGRSSTQSSTDDCCYDIGLSDKTYGDALDKAKVKAENVCGRKGVSLVPVNLHHEQAQTPGFKYKTILNYECGVEKNY